jgi:sodium/bile acid cotransporter 7
MIYHPLQLIVCSVMAESYANRNRERIAQQNAELISAR